jgi:hypothetical protein
MTPEELELLVLGQGPQGNVWMARAFDGMPESERAALAPTAQQLFTDLGSLKPGPKTSPGVAAYIAEYLANLKPEDRGRTVPAAYPRAAHAVMALCPLNWASKAEVKAYVGSQGLPVILQERKPVWLTQWLEADYRGGWHWGQIYADTVLKWIAAGICTRPAVDEFTARVASEIIHPHSATLRGTPDQPKLDFVSLLRARPELIAYVPDFFRVDCEAFKKEAMTRRDTCGRTFPEALVALSQSGELERGALIDLTFEGLAAEKVLRNSKSGMIEFLALLGATPQEKAARQDRLFALLQSPVPQVRTFAINEAAGLEKAGVLDVALAAQEVPLIFSQEGKATAIAALKLLDRMAKQAKKAKASPDGALAALVEGLRHASDDVQGKAIAVLAAHAKALGQQHWDLIASYGDFVAPTRQTELQALLAQSGNAAPTPLAAMPVIPASYAPQPRALMAAHVLDEADRIAPITDLDTLIAALLRALEYVDTPDDIERIIDGISRLADQRPADFERRIAPLRQRIEADNWKGNGLTALQRTRIEYPSDAVALLVRVWIGMVQPGAITTDNERAAYHPFLPAKAHLRALYQDVAKRKASPLLSFPTHRGGWIDPREWVARMQVRTYSKPDMLRSLARLAPDHRAEALAQAGSIRGDTGRIARFALGGDEWPGWLAWNDYDLWITAARCRDPLADWSDLAAKLRTDDPWPGGARPAQYHPHFAPFMPGAHNPNLAVHFKAMEEDWDAASRTWRPRGDRHPMIGGIAGSLDESYAKARLIEARPFAAAASYPDEARDWAYGMIWVQQWLGYQCPLDARAACLKGARMAFDLMDERNPELRGVFDVLFDRHRPWGEEGHGLAIIGLMVREPEASGLAIDALAHGIDHGLFDPSVFAALLTRFEVGGWMKLNRLASALARVVTISPTHAAAISQGMQTWLTRFDLSERGAHELLAVLDQAHAAMIMAVSAELAAKLRELEGASKTAKLARSILVRTQQAA